MTQYVFAVEERALRLRAPFVVGGEPIETRQVLAITAAALSDPAFPRAAGEAAPLPGLHDETLDDVLEALAGDAQDAVFADALDVCGLYLADQPPSLRFALESIWLTWQAHAAGTVPARVLREDARDHVDVCALVEAEPTAVVPMGARAVKVKLGRREADVEREALTRLLGETPDDVEIRLDANRAWRVAEAATRLDGLDPARIAFVEEPLADPAQLPSFHETTGLRVALDESLHDAEHAALRAHDAVTAYVVKPSRWGIYETLQLDAQAVEHGKRVIVSSCFESGLGLAMLAQLAAALRSHDGAAGLGTAAWFDPVPEIAGYDAEALRFATDAWVRT